jgi:putative hydrolase of the HAD superfamily
VTAYKALLIDALGTTVRLPDPAPPLRAELAARFGIQVTEDEARGAFAAEIAYYRAHHDDAVDAPSLAALRERCAAVLRAALPSHARTATPASEAPALLQAALRFEAYADALTSLPALREAGVERIVVVSNWDVSLHEVLADLGVRPLVDAVVTSAEAGARKPARAIFERALARAGVDAASAVHVGDSLEADVNGALAAGIDAILIARDRQPRPPGVRCISSLSELTGS